MDAFAGDPTLLQALSTSGGGIYALGRHATAALLNAVNTDVAYAISSAEVIASTRAALLSGDADTIESTKNRFAQFNEAGCSLN